MKKRMFATVLIISMVLAGCAKFPDLTDDDSAMISQYIAGAVLNSSDRYKHSFNYDKSVLNPTPKPVPVKTAAPASKEDQGNGTMQGIGSQGTGTGKGSGTGTGNGGSSTPAKESVSLSQIYGIQGISVKPLSATSKKHISTSYSSISADKDKKLVIVSFAIKNNSSKTKKVNFANKETSYSITIGGKSYGQAKLTIAEGDLLSFNENIAAGGSKKGVLIFEADSSVKLKDVVVKAVRSNKEASFNLK